MADIEHSDVCPHPRGECECGGFVAASDLADAIQRRDDCEREVTALRDQLWGAIEALEQIIRNLDGENVNRNIFPRTALRIARGALDALGGQ